MGQRQTDAARRTRLAALLSGSLPFACSGGCSWALLAAASGAGRFMRTGSAALPASPGLPAQKHALMHTNASLWPCWTHH